MTDTQPSIIDELRDIRSRKLEIASYQERIERLRSAMTRTTTAITGMPGAAPRPDKLAGQIAQAEALADMLFGRIVECEARIIEVEQAVDMLPRNYRQVLRLRYFEGFDWEGVAGTMHYSIRRCTQLHRLALDRLANDCQQLPTKQA